LQSWCWSKTLIIILNPCFKTSTKVKSIVAKWKGETQIDLNVNHELLNSNMNKWISMFLRWWCDTYYSKLRDMWFIINMQLINQNIKSLNNVKFEIKSQTLHMNFEIFMSTIKYFWIFQEINFFFTNSFCLNKTKLKILIFQK
jgi:hypothetical protein